MNFTFIFTLCFALMGCSRNYQVQPSELPIAHMNKNYSQDITITGGRVIERSFEIKTNFPSDMGVEVKPINTNDISAYNKLRVEGVPKYKGAYDISISVGFYGAGDDELSKTYKFVVN
ncbi:hypothetical protein GCM10025882_40280 [Acinetobacter gyllenbergii]|uniref:Uncharacterized protein n=1 Tax=Acinetobacter gyllenbergii CIP 110306 = MTCC 11365 TaxID=1217657 RepID=A0A829HCJ0_9GAMM|nr:hypothetical protein [Acinetobacter gyllenbergii]EPF74392.1 hypothetical protein F957_03488 [Acinetobacter gyllenbergii CIP 110306 = MTCC 11365]GMA13601.1 hypothetical protein GCM10025882_40280 [Acinetobacter gyllenbergii]